MVSGSSEHTMILVPILLKQSPPKYGQYIVRHPVMDIIVNTGSIPETIAKFGDLTAFTILVLELLPIQRPKADIADQL